MCGMFFFILYGHVKKQLLQSLLPQNHIVDLKVPFYSLTSLRKCTFSSYHTQCSLNNCYKLKTFSNTSSFHKNKEIVL